MMKPRFDSFVDILRKRAIATPAQQAFGFLHETGMDEEVLSYGSLDRDARTIAVHLQRTGLAGERAVLLYQPGLDYIRAIFGCLYAGVVAVPVYAPRVNGSYERVRHTVLASHATALLSVDSVLSRLDQPKWRELVAIGMQLTATDRLNPVHADNWKKPVLDREDLAVLQFTSGSTGLPRGVMLRHRHLIANSEMIREMMACSANSVGVVWIPPYHDMGLIGGILQPVYSGFPAHLLSQYSFLQRPMRWLKTIARYRATHSSAPNFAYQLCTNRAKPQDVAELDLSSWAVAANGAEPIRAETLAAFAAVFAPCGFRPEAMFPCYGLAEATLLATGTPYLAGPRTCDVNAAALGIGTFTPDSGPQSRTVVSSGVPAPGVEVHIVDPVSLEPCGLGQIGEVWLRGEAIATGYWESPEETARTFGGLLPDAAGPCLRTGDLGCMHAGELYITGRMKDLIIIRGQNHYPHDIESTVAASHAALRPGGTAAFALEDAGAEALGVVQEVERGQHPGLEVLEAAIRDAVSRQHQLSIARLVLVRHGTVPKTSSGKVRRLFCREQLMAGDLVFLNAGGR